MSSSKKLDEALDTLRKNGHSIGTPAMSVSGKMLIPIDDAPRSFDEIYGMAADYGERKK